MKGDSKSCMSLCALIWSHPIGTLTEAKTRSKSDWIWTCTSTSWCAQPPTHGWREVRHYASTCWWSDRTRTTNGCMLSNELDRGAISVHPHATKASVRLSKMSPLSTWTPSWTTKLGISSSPSTITSMSNSWSHHNGLSVSDVLHGLLKPFCLTWVHVHCNVTSCQMEVQVSIVECNSHRVVGESWG